MIVKAAEKFDVVYFLKVPAIELYRRILALGRPRMVIDFNDCLWMPHHAISEYLIEMLQTSHGVICENDFVATYARRFNPRVEVVPDYTQMGAFDEIRNTVNRNSDVVRIGWIGSAGTAHSLYLIWEVLERLFERRKDIELRIVGADREHLPNFENVRYTCVRDYDRERMVREALSMDIGLFPLFRVQDSWARGNGKAVVYMSAGVVPVCSNFGEHTKIITDGQNGMLAGDAAEWEEKIELLIQDAELRKQMSNSALETVRTILPDHKCFEALISAFQSISR
jgi:glycosyltransferase involved in cell wall biosynthesis